ncbi:mitochondrial coenzyme A diphosphatase NUDT8-like, partial [Glandiceps talaboti]
TSLSKLSSPTLEKALTSIFSDEGKRRAIKRMENTKPLRTLTKHASQLGAVCIPLCVIDGEPSVLYTLRTIHLSQHRGEVSFPGGMAEQGDKDLNHTALRELEEELGISADSVEVWGSLIPLPDKSGKKAVTPIIGYVGELDLDALKPNEGEVEDVFTLTFKQLCTSENQRYTHFKATGPRRESMAMPVFLGGPHRIWGLTAIITDQMLRVLLPTVYKSVVNYKR